MPDDENKNKENPLANAIMGFNRKREDDFLHDLLNIPPEVQSQIQALTSAPGVVAESIFPGGFAESISAQMLLRLEKAVIRSEWYESLGKPSVENSADCIARYAQARSKVEAKFGSDAVAEMLQRARKAHNECARDNLDNSNGLLYCWVLPEFNSDGSHEPIGPRDVPWGNVKD